jgi:hypothetical protein
VCSASRVLFAFTAVFVLALAGCGTGEQAQNEPDERTQSSSDGADQESRRSELTVAATVADGPQEITPLLAEVPYAPVPFAGSDGRTHLVYELEATNFSSGETTIEQLEVQEGDRVKRGDVLALVGNSGNSLAPHLHFHVMSGQLSLASNGLPYFVDSFTVTGRTAGTDAFDEAEGTPLEVTPADPVEAVTEAMPLDQSVVSFD